MRDKLLESKLRDAIGLLQEEGYKILPPSCEKVVIFSNTRFECEIKNRFHKEPHKHTTGDDIIGKDVVISWRD